MTSRDPILVHCADCSHEWSLGFYPITCDLFAQVGKSPCPACRSKAVMIGALPRPTEVGRAEAWLRNGDTGTSSQTIWQVLMRQTVARTHNNWPCDPSDFGRCHRLLQVMPTWRARLGEVAAAFPGTPWVKLIARWDEVELLYIQQLNAEERNNRLPKRKRQPITYPCYELMKEIGC